MYVIIEYKILPSQGPSIEQPIYFFYLFNSLNVKCLITKSIWKHRHALSNKIMVGINKLFEVCHNSLHQFLNLFFSCTTTYYWFLFAAPFHSASFIFILSLSMPLFPFFNFSSPETEPQTAQTWRVLSDQKLGGERLQAHRDKQVAKGGDDATAKTHDQRTIRSDHELCCCSHGNTTCQSGILDMHLSGRTAC